MHINKIAPFFTGLFIGLILFSCKKEVSEITPVTKPSVNGVNIDLTAVPYNTLSEYQFFDGVLADHMPAEGVIPYEPVSKLFTDYAKKKRFIWMPEGTRSEEHTSELQSRPHLVCRLLLEKKKKEIQT